MRSFKNDTVFSWKCDWSYVVNIATSEDLWYLIIKCDENLLHIWNYEYKNEITVIPGDITECQNLIVTKDSKYLISAGRKKTVNVWNFFDKNLKVQFQGHTDRITCLDVSKDGNYVVSGGWDGSVRLWNIIKEVPEAVLLKHKQKYFPELNINGYDIIGGGDDCLIRVWNEKTQKQVLVLKGHTYRVKALKLCPTKNYVVSFDEGGIVRVWKIFHDLV